MSEAEPQKYVSIQIKIQIHGEDKALLYEFPKLAPSSNDDIKMHIAQEDDETAFALRAARRRGLEIVPPPPEHFLEFLIDHVRLLQDENGKVYTLKEVASDGG